MFVCVKYVAQKSSWKIPVVVLAAVVHGGQTTHMPVVYYGSLLEIVFFATTAAVY